MRSYLPVIFLALLIQSCSYSDKDFNLSDNERDFLNAFKKGDTLYYVSSNNMTDTFLVRGIDSAEKKETGSFMALPAYKSVWISIKHLPVDTFYSGVFPDTTRNKMDTSFNQIITISKEPQSKKTEYTFMFKRFLASSENEIGKLNKDTITINSKLISDYYIIKNKWQSDSASTAIECLYWTKKEGLVAYKYNNGTCWTKKSNR
jgi:hypothetical protein